MQANLKEYLLGSTSPEILALFDQSIALLDNFSIEDYQTEYDDLLLGSDGFENADLMDGLIDFTTDMLISILKQHGIMPIEEIAFPVVISLVQAVWDIQNVGEGAHVLDILSTEVGDVEKLSNILAVVGSMSSDQYMNTIRMINPSIFKSIEYTLKHRPDDTEDLIKSAGILSEDKIRKINLLFTDNKEAYLFEQLRAGMKTGSSFNNYVKLHATNVFAQDNKEVARTLLAFAIISSDGDSNPMELTNAALAQYVADMDHIAQIKSEMSGFFVLLNQAPSIKIQ